MSQLGGRMSMAVLKICGSRRVEFRLDHAIHAILITLFQGRLCLSG